VEHDRAARRKGARWPAQLGEEEEEGGAGRDQPSRGALPSGGDGDWEGECGHVMRR